MFLCRVVQLWSVWHTVSWGSETNTPAFLCVCLRVSKISKHHFQWRKKWKLKTLLFLMCWKIFIDLHWEKPLTNFWSNAATSARFLREKIIKGNVWFMLALFRKRVNIFHVANRCNRNCLLELQLILQTVSLFVDNLTVKPGADRKWSWKALAVTASRTDFFVRVTSWQHQKKLCETNSNQNDTKQTIQGDSKWKVIIRLLMIPKLNPANTSKRCCGERIIQICNHTHVLALRKMSTGKKCLKPWKNDLILICSRV